MEVKYTHINLPQDLAELTNIVNLAFKSTPDSSVDQWFSFDVMAQNINTGQGICIKAINESNKILGMIYAQMESPINNQEGREKWVIVIIGVNPSFAKNGIGSKLLANLETEVKQHEAKKLFVYTNYNDTKVIQFYRNNKYIDAGWIKDYQYGKDNSAIFLLKYL